MGKKARLKPMNMTQNVHLPSRSSSIRPVNFGNQKWIPPTTGKTLMPSRT